MPRTSTAALSVVTPADLDRTSRAAPPAELTDEQRLEWLAVANRLPADWFPRETHGLLAQFCRHVVAARRVAQLIAACEAREELDLNEYDRLLKMQEREGRAISSLATRMRISQQATSSADKRKPSQKAPKPWE